MTARPIIAVHPSFSAAKGAVFTAATIKSGRVPVFPRHSLSVKNFLHAQRRKNHDKKLLHDFYVENVPAWHEAGSSFIKTKRSGSRSDHDGIEHGDADKTIDSFTKAVERFANMT